MFTFSAKRKAFDPQTEEETARVGGLKEPSASLFLFYFRLHINIPVIHFLIYIRSYKMMKFDQKTNEQTETGSG